MKEKRPQTVLQFRQSPLKNQKLRDGVRQSNVNRPCRALNSIPWSRILGQSAGSVSMSSVVERCGEVLCASACMLSVFASDGALTDNCPVGPISGLSSLKTPPPTTTKQQARTKHWPLELKNSRVTQFCPSCRRHLYLRPSKSGTWLSPHVPCQGRTLEVKGRWTGTLLPR